MICSEHLTVCRVAPARVSLLVVHAMVRVIPFIDSDGALWEEGSLCRFKRDRDGSSGAGSGFDGFGFHWAETKG